MVHGDLPRQHSFGTTLRLLVLCRRTLGSENAIGTQLRDPINSGLTRWRMAVLTKQMDDAAELGRNPVSKMSRLTRDGTAEPVSRNQILWRERGQGNIHFPCSAEHEQDWQPYTVDPYSCYVCDDKYTLSDEGSSLYCNTSGL